MVHHMVHDGITWCITHLVRYMARLRELEVGGSVDVVQRKGQLRWGKASGGVAKGTSLPLLLFFSSSLSICVSPFSSAPLSPAMHLSFSFSPCLPITPSHPFPPLISPALAWVTGMISLVELSTKQKRRSVLRSFSRLIWPKAAAGWCVRPLSPGCLGVYSEVFVITRSRLRPSDWPIPAGAAGAWAKDESHEYTVVAEDG